MPDSPPPPAFFSNTHQYCIATNARLNSAAATSSDRNTALSTCGRLSVCDSGPLAPSRLDKSTDVAGAATRSAELRATIYVMGSDKALFKLTHELTNI